MRSKWLIGALAASLVVNLVLIGFVAGRMSSGFAPGAGIDPTLGLPRLLRFMEEERRREVLADAISYRRELRPTLRQMRAVQRRIHASVTADPFEEDALRNAFNDFRGNLEASQAKSHEAFVTVVSRLTPEERRLLAEAMRRPHRRPEAPGGRR